MTTPNWTSEQHRLISNNYMKYHLLHHRQGTDSMCWDEYSQHQWDNYQSSPVDYNNTSALLL